MLPSSIGFGSTRDEPKDRTAKEADTMSSPSNNVTKPEQPAYDDNAVKGLPAGEPLPKRKKERGPNEV